MKITRLTSYWDIEQVMTILDMLNELTEALLNTYDKEIDLYQQQQWAEKQQQQNDNPDLFDDPVDL